MEFEKKNLENDLVLKELPYFEGVCFDPDVNAIYGNYKDEISAYRAKKAWAEALRFNFSLDKEDIEFKISNSNQDTFVLICSFCSATAKYAFWKITNHQAPEAQYIIETAHIPICDSRYDEILTAPDLKSIYDLPLVTNPRLSQKIKTPTRTLNKILKSVLTS